MNKKLVFSLLIFACILLLAYLASDSYKSSLDSKLNSSIINKTTPPEPEVYQSLPENQVKDPEITTTNDLDSIILDLNNTEIVEEDFSNIE